MNTSSCDQKEPFVKLEPNGQASILDYNLPQSTCYNATSYLRLDLPAGYIPDPTPPRDNYWDLVEQRSKEGWVEVLEDEMKFASKSRIFENQELIQKDGVTKSTTDKKIIESVTSGTNRSSNKSAELEELISSPKIAGESLDTIAEIIKKGYKPVFRQNIYGKVYLSYLKRPQTFQPKITIALRLKMCSYLGDYGAGKTLKTFSLLPGERTTITIKNWERTEETKSQASNVLDSLSESSANELQTIVNQESSSSVSFGTETTSEETLEAGLDISIPGTGIGVNAGGSTTNSQTFSSALQNGVSNLVNSTTSQTSKADSLRQTEINTESSSTSISENEQLVVRELENINKSRVLNFVFRQLLQEYFTITYLHDVSFIYTDGYPENKKVTNLAGLPTFLEGLIPDPDKKDEVFGMILNRLCGIVDYQGTKQGFLECVEEELACDLDCSCIPDITPETTCYLRKKADLEMTYKGKKVPGIILDTTHRIVRTPALVVDALLGQGEALDCYNQKLQVEAVESAELDNASRQQMIDIINGLSDPIQRAVLYKKVFGDCCDVAQSGGCCDCNEQNP